MSEADKLDILERYIGAGTTSAVYLILERGISSSPYEALVLLRQIQDEAGGR